MSLDMLSLVSPRSSKLTMRAQEVADKDSVTLLIGAMWAVMYHNKGIGLAANQLGQLDRVIVVHANGFKQAIINPIITKSYGGKTLNREGCLSFPGLQTKVIRHKQIIVEGYDANWKPVKRKLKGLAAYCVQHEVDHLNGITINE